MGGCCGIPRLSVIDCFNAGRRRQRLPLLDCQGPVVPAADGVQAAFSVDIREGRLRAVRFRATSCVTLVAYCERLCQLVEGRSQAEAGQVDTRALADSLTGVPFAKRARATLAVAALGVALRQHDDADKWQHLHKQDLGSIAVNTAPTYNIPSNRSAS